MYQSVSFRGQPSLASLSSWISTASRVYLLHDPREINTPKGHEVELSSWAWLKKITEKITWLNLESTSFIVKQSCAREWVSNILSLIRLSANVYETTWNFTSIEVDFDCRSWVPSIKSKLEVDWSRRSEISIDISKSQCTRRPLTRRAHSVSRFSVKTTISISEVTPWIAVNYRRKIPQAQLGASFEDEDRWPGARKSNSLRYRASLTAPAAVNFSSTEITSDLSKITAESGKLTAKWESATNEALACARWRMKCWSIFTFRGKGSSLLGSRDLPSIGKFCLSIEVLISLFVAKFHLIRNENSPNRLRSMTAIWTNSANMNSPLLRSRRFRTKFDSAPGVHPKATSRRAAVRWCDFKTFSLSSLDATRYELNASWSKTTSLASTHAFHHSFFSYGMMHWLRYLLDRPP